MQLREKINPQHTALLVIDIQKDFAAPDGLLARRGRDISMAQAMIPRLKKTILIASEALVPTFYAKQIYDRSKLNDLQKEQYDLDGKSITCDIATEGHEFYEIDPPPASVFVKYNYNVFSNPDFEKALVAHGVKTLVVTGMDTHWCVETAIRNGFDLGYKIVVPEDLVACNGRHLEFHNRTLELTRKTFGVVVSSEELNSIWSERS